MIPVGHMVIIVALDAVCVGVGFEGNVINDRFRFQAVPAYVELIDQSTGKCGCDEGGDQNRNRII